MSDRTTALIVGSGREQGLGFAVARELARANYHVILTARRLGDAEARRVQLTSEQFSASALSLDVSDRASVDACATTIRSDFGHLDVLINNHSVVPDFDAGSVLDADPEYVRHAYDVNVVGTWQLTQALLPMLRAAPAARIVNVSSQDALRVAHADRPDEPTASPGFSFAKYALNALTVALATALTDTAILVNAVDPGETASHPEAGDEGSARPPSQSAHGVVWAATLDADGPTGGFFKDGRPLS